MIRFFQIIHLGLIVGIAAVYACLKSFLPPEDPARTIIDIAISVMAAVWAAVIFIEMLRGAPEGSTKERLLKAYRRLLNKSSTLIVGDILLGTACTAGICFLLLFRSVDFFSVSDAEIFQSDPGTTPHKVGILKGNSTGQIRLRIGDRWLIAYATVTQDGAVMRMPLWSTRVEVTPFWKEMKRVDIPELKPYEHLNEEVPRRGHIVLVSSITQCELRTGSATAMGSSE